MVNTDMKLLDTSKQPNEVFNQIAEYLRNARPSANFDTLADEIDEMAKDWVLRLDSLSNIEEGKISVNGNCLKLYAQAFANMLKGKPLKNYIQMHLDHKDIGKMTVTLQRVEGLSPAEKLNTALERIQELEQSNQLKWNNPETTPTVKLGTEELFWIAVQSSRREEPFVFLAYFQNRPCDTAIANDDGPVEHWAVSNEHDGYVSSVGWVENKAHYDYSEFYEPLEFNDDYKLLAWAEYIAPKFTGVICDRNDQDS
ncbi:hypothetical protein [Marinicellulosiphila megalodicopiae]|uniref:hypothetical protein n=1 Tax=Marinicellulosiphila megalodicopiae TaxID=2724896 RepID=UPI003BAEBFEE